MFWPLMLPAQITAIIMVLMVLSAPVIAIALKWKPGWLFSIAMLLAVVGFIPACTGIMHVIDAQRFGIFQYQTYTEVQDFRVERYLPTSARAITLEKTAMGHRAKYTISAAELRDFLDQLWAASRGESSIARAELLDGQAATPDEIKDLFQDLGWPPLKNAIRLHSPIEADGGGATYFIDAAAGIVYHRAGYW